MMRWMMWWITLVSARCIQRATVSSLLPTYDVSAKARCISGSTENGTHLAVEMLKANQPGSLPRICSIDAISRLSSSAPLGSSSAGSDPALPLPPLPFFFPLLRLLDRGAPTASAGRSASSSTHCSMARGRRLGGGGGATARAPPGTTIKPSPLREPFPTFFKKVESP
jgi:hypothetical protein